MERIVVQSPLGRGPGYSGTVEAEQSNVSLRIRHARWLGPNLVPSLNLPETTETVDDQNHRDQTSSRIEPEDEDGIDYIDDIDDEDEGKEHETNEDEV
jgi:hypothetical protein